MALILQPSPESLILAAQALRAGAIIIFPTETVYGLGCDLRDQQAIDRIYQVKGRKREMPLMAHCSDEGQLSGLVREIPERARPLIKRFWPGPLALVFLSGPTAAAQGRTIGIRMVANNWTRELIRLLGVPIMGTSANFSSEPATGDFTEIRPELIEVVDIAIDAGRAGSGQASTVLDVTTEPPRLIRAGAVPIPEIEKVLGSQVGQV